MSLPPWLPQVSVSRPGVARASPRGGPRHPGPMSASSRGSCLLPVPPSGFEAAVSDPVWDTMWCPWPSCHGPFFSIGVCCWRRALSRPRPGGFLFRLRLCAAYSCRQSRPLLHQCPLSSRRSSSSLSGHTRGRSGSGWSRSLSA